MIEWLLRARVVLLALAVLLFVGLHAPHLDAPPSGFHKWRESDTATVAETYYRGGLALAKPEVYLIGPKGTTVVGLELPLYNYTVAVLYRALGFSHQWARLLSLVGGVLLALGVWRVTTRLAPRSAGRAALAFWLTLFAPLVYFYAGKIQPDVWGMALATWGFAHFLAFRSGGRLALSAALLALAGGIKPTFLFVGLPMLAVLRHQGGLARHARDWRLWVFAAAILTPIALWLSHARRLTEGYGDAYFYLGQNWTAALASLGDPQFYQNALLTWPFELVIGLPFVPYFLAGLVRWRSLPARDVWLAWIVGSFVVFALAAGHIATPHDYYYLPILPALVAITAHGLVLALEATSRHRRWLVPVTIVLLVAAPAHAFFRMDQRHGADSDFWEVRALVQRRVPAEATLVVVDRIPGFQLYRAGRSGLRIPPDAAQGALDDALQRGGDYLLHDETTGELPPHVKARLEERPVGRAGSTALWRIRREASEP